MPVGVSSVPWVWRSSDACGVVWCSPKPILRRRSALSMFAVVCLFVGLLVVGGGPSVISASWDWNAWLGDLLV